MYYLLLTATFIPLVAALLSLIRNERRYTAAVSVASLLLSLSLIAYTAFYSGLFTNPATSRYLESYSWQPLGNVGFQLDGLSLTFSLIIALVGSMVAIYSYYFMDKHFETLGSRRWSAYYFLYLTFIFGMLGTVLSTNLVEFYIFFELMLIPSYFLIAEFGYSGRSNASFSYFIWTHIGALVMLAGLIAIAFTFRTLDLNAIYAYTHGSAAPFIISSRVVLYASVAILLGLMVKLGGFGLHVWLPSAYKEAPAPVSATLSALMSGIAGYAIIRILAFDLPTSFAVISPYLVIWGIISLLYGGFTALSQDDVRLLLAYSSVSQMGYMAIGIGSNTAFGLAGSISLYAANGFAKAILFMMAGLLTLQTGQIAMSRMGGLAGRLPYMTTFSMIGFLTMMGVPPTFGFIAEFFIFQGIFASSLLHSSSSLLLLAFLALIGSIITSAYSLWAVKKIFFGRQTIQNPVAESPSSHATSIMLRQNSYLLLPLAILAAASVIAGIYPFLFSNSFAYLSSVLLVGVVS
ncbi:MAG: NADH-quinone oxidoreductase subunit M [Conexivisphaerales archaeon]